MSASKRCGGELVDSECVFTVELDVRDQALMLHASDRSQHQLMKPALNVATLRRVNSLSTGDTAMIRPRAALSESAGQCDHAKPTLTSNPRASCRGLRERETRWTSASRCLRSR
jgi:hypothetical protein